VEHWAADKSATTSSNMARISPSVLLIALFPAAVFAQTNLYLPPDVTDGDKAQMGGYTMAQIEAWTASFGMVNSWRNTPSAWANSTNVDPNGGLGELFIKGVRKRVHNLKLISGGSGVVVTGIYAILMESGTISAMEKLTLQFGTSTGKPAAAGMNRRNVDMNLQPLINKQWYEATPARPPNYRPARPPNYRPPSPPSAPASETYWGDTSGADTYLFTRDDVMDPGCYHVGVDPHDETKALLVAVVGAGWAQKRITAAVFKIGDGTSSVPEPPLGFQQVRSAFSISYPGVTIEPAGLDLKNILDQTGGYVSMCSHTLFGTNGRPITWSLLKGSANRTAAPWHVQV